MRLLAIIDIGNIVKGITEKTGGSRAINPSSNPDDPASAGTVFDPNLVTQPEYIYYRIIYLLIWVIGVVVVLAFVYGGFLYLTAGGEAEKAERGKKVIVGALIGLIIFATSYMAYNTFAKILERGNSQNVEDIMKEPASQNVH